MSADHGVVPLIQMADLYMPAALPHIVALINKVYMRTMYHIHSVMTIVTSRTVEVWLVQLSVLLFS
jgi:hypothetical protein